VLLAARPRRSSAPRPVLSAVRWPALDRLDDPRALLCWRSSRSRLFRPNRLWQLPFLGLHDYALPQTLDIWFGGMTKMAEELEKPGPSELVVVCDGHQRRGRARGRIRARLLVPASPRRPEAGAGRSSRRLAVSALVMPLRVGRPESRPTGAWVRNFSPLAHAYSHDDVELIVAFRLLFAQYPPPWRRSACKPLRQTGSHASARSRRFRAADRRDRRGRGSPPSVGEPAQPRRADRAARAL